MNVPETRFATTADGVSLAYQIVSEGPLDIVLVNSAFASNMEIAWEFDPIASVFRGLAARGRLVMFDRRGAGLSDGVSGERIPTLETTVEDIRTVMDAAGSERAVLFGIEDGGAQSFLFAATYPNRATAVITIGAASRGMWAPDAPWLWTEEQWAEDLAAIERGWGSHGYAEGLAQQVYPTRADDAGFVRDYARLMRHSLRKVDALAAERMWKDMDVRHVLPLIQAPTLVMHFSDDRIESVEEGRYLAEHIPGARFLALPGADHGAMGATVPQIDGFLSSLQAEEAEFDRVLATVLFTDIVASTSKASELGDHGWGALVERHHAMVRSLLGRYRGTEVDTAGDGFFATFDGPARAVRCARAIVAAVQPLGIEVRAGVHTGEVEMVMGKPGGVAVHVGSRIASSAGASDVLVSQTVKDLTVGSGLVFEDAGEHDLKGVPDRWRLFRVMA